MKKILFFFPLFCVFSLSAQQDWDLFPLGQHSWFVQNDSVFQYYNDSTLISGEEREHFFGAKYLYESFGNCTEEILSEFWENEDLNFSLKVDTLQSTPDFFFSKLDADTLKFHHLAEVGESWFLPTATNDSFQITCLSLVETEVFGFTDSLKTFDIQFIQNGIPVSHPLNEEIFQLSKKSGFTQFFSFQDLYFSSQNTSATTLVGMKKDEDNYGHTENFMDYFHYEIGDILKWHSYDRDSPNAEFTAQEEWFIDTITNISVVNNLLRLNVNRTNYIERSENGVVTDNFTEVGTTAVFAISQILMDSFLQTPVHHPVAYFQNLRYLRQPSITDDLDITATADFIQPKAFDLIDCSSEIGNDNTGNFIINTTLGFKETTLEREEDGSYFLELLGYQSGDFMWGELEAVPIISNTNDVSESIFEIYPNPASEVIHIGFPQDVNKMTISVYNVNGQIVLEKTLNQESNLSLNSLQNGVYFIKLQSENFQEEKRIVVRR